jgi:hypothetical protein
MATPIARAGVVSRRGKPIATTNQRQEKLIHEPAKEEQVVAAAKNLGGAVHLRTDVAALPPRNGFEAGTAILVLRSDKNIAAVAKTGPYRAKVFELIDAHANAAFEYAQDLTQVRSITEFVELSTNHACKNIERIILQATELGSLMMSNFKRMTAVLAATQVYLQIAERRTLIDHSRSGREPGSNFWGVRLTP